MSNSTSTNHVLPAECYLLPASFPDVSLFFEEQERAQRTKGRGKGERRLGDVVFKMAESAIADNYAIFQSEFRPVHSAYLEQKIACPDPLCKEKPVFCFLLNSVYPHSITKLKVKVKTRLT